MKPSRQMPPYVPEPMTWRSWGCLVGLIVLVGMFIAGCWEDPWLLVPLGSVFFIFLVLNHFHQRRWRKKLAAMMQDRADESICTFAREFDTHKVDTWIIRAVHEELRPYVRGDDFVVPIRADDRLIEDLEIDEDDLWIDMPMVICKRTGRSLDEFENNPYYGEIETVRDLVLFYNHQPRAETCAENTKRPSSI